MALLHNPNPKVRSPLALWVSFDGMKTWPYQRVLRPSRLHGRFNYPDGFVSADRWLHFAFDDNRYKAIHVSAKLPEVFSLWDGMGYLHGAMLSTGGKLWAFNFVFNATEKPNSYVGKPGLGTVIYVLDESTGVFQKRGKIEDNFWT